MQQALTDIRKESQSSLIEIFKAKGQPAYRAKQVHEWLWKKSATSFDEMTNLPKDLRAWLNENYAVRHAWKSIEQISDDGTVKIGFELHDKRVVEGVMIPTESRTTACVSSQVGCTLQCQFCATGMLKRERNLDFGEIYDQVVMLNEVSKQNHNRPLSNIVFMGMGEPLLNYDNVMSAIRFITSEDGLHMSAKRITVSTVGIARGIKKLADEGVKFNLALSLHAPTDDKRNEIMPINKSNNIESLVEALNYFYDKTGNKITFEYILFDQFNDSIEDARQLVKLARQVPCHINIIEYNYVEGVNLAKATQRSLNAFTSYLEHHKVSVTVRRSRGEDIDAACGQLANKAND